MAYGVTNTGFVRKRLEQILDGLDTQVKGVFGNDMLIGPEDPFGQVNAIVAEELSILWQAAEMTYNSGNPNKAIAAQLDDVSAYSGTKRNDKTKSYATVSVVGDAGTTVLAGALTIESSDYGNKFVNTADFTLDAGGNADINVDAVEFGPIPVNTNTLTIISTPINGIQSVSNSTAGTVGRNRETDPEFRVRRRRSVALASGYGVDALYAVVGGVDGVSDMNILVNESEVTDANGLPEHSFMVIVTGGVDYDIAKAISTKKGIGITAHGTTIVQIPDISGKDQPIGLHRPTPVNIWVRVNATALPGISATATEDIKQAIVDYANGDLISDRGFFSGDDVLYFELYTPVNQVDKISVTSLDIGYQLNADFSVDWIQTDIPITDLEKSVFTTANIEVNIV